MLGWIGFRRARGEAMLFIFLWFCVVPGGSANLAETFCACGFLNEMTCIQRFVHRSRRAEHGTTTVVHPSRRVEHGTTTEVCQGVDGTLPYHSPSTTAAVRHHMRQNLAPVCVASATSGGRMTDSSSSFGRLPASTIRVATRTHS